MATSPPVVDLVSANCLEFMLTAASKPTFPISTVHGVP